MSAEIFFEGGGKLFVHAPYEDGTVRIELYNEDGDMSACDLTPEDRHRIAAAIKPAI